MNEEIASDEISGIDIDQNGLLKVSIGRSVGGHLDQLDGKAVGQLALSAADLLAVLISSSPQHITVSTGPTSESAMQGRVARFSVSFRDVPDGELGVAVRPLQALPGGIPCSGAMLVTSSTSPALSAGDIIVAVSGLPLTSLTPAGAAALLTQDARRLTILSSVWSAAVGDGDKQADTTEPVSQHPLGGAGIALPPPPVVHHTSPPPCPPSLAISPPSSPPGSPARTWRNIRSAFVHKRPRHSPAGRRYSIASDLADAWEADDRLAKRRAVLRAANLLAASGTS